MQTWQSPPSRHATVFPRLSPHWSEGLRPGGLASTSAPWGLDVAGCSPAQLLRRPLLGPRVTLRVLGTFPHVSTPHLVAVSVPRGSPLFRKWAPLVWGGAGSQSQTVMLMSMPGSITAELIAFWTDALSPSPAPGFSTELGDVPESNGTVVSWEVSGGGGLPSGGRDFLPAPFLPQSNGLHVCCGGCWRMGANPGVMILPSLPWLPGTAPREPWLGRMCPLGGAVHLPVESAPAPKGRASVPAGGGPHGHRPQVGSVHLPFPSDWPEAAAVAMPPTAHSWAQHPHGQLRALGHGPGIGSHHAALAGSRSRLGSCEFSGNTLHDLGSVMVQLLIVSLCRLLTVFIS